MKNKEKLAALFLCALLMGQGILAGALPAPWHPYAFGAQAEQEEATTTPPPTPIPPEPERNPAPQPPANPPAVDKEEAKPPKKTPLPDPSPAKKEPPEPPAEAKGPADTTKPLPADPSQPPPPASKEPPPAHAEDSPEPSPSQEPDTGPPVEGGDIPEESPEVPPEETPEVPPVESPVESPEAPEETPEAPEETPELLLEETPEPLPPGDIHLGSRSTPSAFPGEALTLAVSLKYTLGEETYLSHMGRKGKALSYRSKYTPEDYDQAIGQVLPNARIELIDVESGALSAGGTFASQERAVTQNGVNYGYAVFPHLHISETAAPGTYAVQLEVTWEEGGQRRTKTLVKNIRVKEPEPELEPEPLSLPGDMALASHPIPCAPPGEALTLAVNLAYTRDGETYLTHMGSQGEALDYRSGHTPEDYDQALGQLLPNLRVTLLNAPSGLHLPTMDLLSQERAVIQGGVNHGYAVFENIPVLANALPGTYPVELEIAWEEDGAWQSTLLVDSIQITEPVAPPGDVELGDFPVPSAEEGGAVTLAFPICYTREDLIYDSNANPNGDTVPYEEGRAPAFDQAITGELSKMSITVAPDQAEGFPLDEGILSESRELIANGENSGYAVFSEVSLLSGAKPGLYPIALDMAWEEQEGEPQVKTVNAFMEIAPLSLEYEGSPIVFTFEQLRAAAEGADGPSTIYLGYCDTTPEPGETQNNGTIQFDRLNGIQVTRSLTIIGKDPRKQENNQPLLVNSGSTGENHSIRATSGNIQITLKDARAESICSRGIVTSSGGSNVNIIFDNVTYTGSQMTYNLGAGSQVTFRGCNVTIQRMPGGEVANEVAEALDVHFYGSNTFVRTSASGARNSMLYLRGAPNRITVHPGASASFETDHYFSFNDTATRTTLTVDGALSVITKDPSGHCMTYGDQRMASVSVRGSLTVDHRRDSAYASLRVHELEVSGSLNMRKTGTSTTEPCIRVMDDNGHVGFQPSGRVSLQNPAGRLIRSSNSNCTLDITTPVINGWPLSDPKRIWNNNGLTPFTTSGRVRENNLTAFTTSLTGGYGAAIRETGGVFRPNDIQLNADNFNLTNGFARLLLGPYAATIDKDTVYYTSEAVSGTAPSGSTNLLKEFDYAQQTLGTPLQEATAELTGDEFHSPEAWEPIHSKDSRVYLLTTLGDLEAHIYAECVEVCLLLKVPPTMDFGAVRIKGQEQWVERQAMNGTLQVLDTRVAECHWTLKASAGPMSTNEGTDTLTGGLVFVPDSGPHQPLTASASVIAEKPAGAFGITDIHWAADKGILLYLAPLDGLPGETYSATITWTLEDA